MLKRIIAALSYDHLIPHKTIIIKLIFILICSCGFRCKGNDEVTMEYYITPRNVNYGYYDNGVFQFNLEKQSIKVPFEERTYACNIKKDSLFELFYLQEQTSNNRLSNLVSFKKIGKDSIWKPRILIIASSDEHSDTLFVDTHLNGLYKGEGYRLNSKFITDLLAIMPIELKESWEKDVPSR